MDMDHTKSGVLVSQLVQVERATRGIGELDLKADLPQTVGKQVLIGISRSPVGNEQDIASGAGWRSIEHWRRSVGA